jgi:predicted transcriptional regulator
MTGKKRQAASRRRSAESKPFQIVRPDQLEAVISTKRHDIMDQITVGGPMSVKELAQAMGVAPSSLYYHVEHLCAVGLLKEAGVRRDGGKPSNSTPRLPGA